MQAVGEEQPPARGFQETNIEILENQETIEEASSKQI